MLLHERAAREQRRRDQEEAQLGAQVVAESNRHIDAGDIIQPATKRTGNLLAQYDGPQWSVGGVFLEAKTEFERCAHEDQVYSFERYGNALSIMTLSSCVVHGQCT